jgi:phosphate butyryltransferase
MRFAQSKPGAKVVGSLALGRANVLGVPGFVARAEAAGLVLGAKAPVMLTSRADNDRARLVSRALAHLYEYGRQEGRAFGDEPTVAEAAE